jgi:hypothetical protein
MKFYADTQVFSCSYASDISGIINAYPDHDLLSIIPFGTHRDRFIVTLVKYRDDIDPEIIANIMKSRPLRV